MFMQKEKGFCKLLSFLMLFALISLAQADNITNYTVPATINMNDYFLIYGDFNDSSGVDANVLCSFLIFDSDNNRLIERLDDEFTLATGEFSSQPYKIEPGVFDYQTDYNVVSICDTGVASQTMTVTNAKTIENDLFYFYAWLWDSGNVIPAAMFLFLGTLMFGAVGIVWFSFKKGGRR